MATKFLVWVEDGTNVESQTTFAGDTQRINGFQVGAAASSIRVNTALRQANLVVSALMDVVAPSANVDVQSSVADVKTVIAEYFNRFLIGPETLPSSQVIPTIKTDGTQQNLTLGTGLSIVNGALTNSLVIPTASSTTAGIVKVGQGLSIDGNQVLSTYKITSGTVLPSTANEGDIFLLYS